MTDRRHRAKVRVAFPDASLGTCKHCGRTCSPNRRQHDGCQEQQRAANDYRGEAARREGAKQRCVDCDRVDGQSVKVAGDYPGGWIWQRVKIERDHPQGLKENGPRDWTVPRCGPCHDRKTQRDRQRREGRRVEQVKSKSKRQPVQPRGVTWWQWPLGIGLIVAAVWVHKHPLTPATFTGDGLAALWADVRSTLVLLAVGAVVGGALGGWWRWVAARHQKALRRLGDMIARETHTDPSKIRLSRLRWRRGIPVRATCKYSALFDDSAGSRDRGRVEAKIREKIGQPLDFTWRPHRDTVTWAPRATGAPKPVEAAAAVDHAAKTLAVKERVEDSVRAAIKGVVDFEWGNADAVGPKTMLVRYPSSFNDDSPEVRQTLVDKVNSKAPGRWRATWDTEENVVRFERRPAMPSMIPAPVPERIDTWRLSFGRDESDREVVWSLREAPHCLVVGGTGSGKTVTLRSIITDATASGFTVFGADPKRIELTGLRGWPGVRAVASKTEEMIALVEMLADEMDARYAEIEAGTTTEADLSPVLVVIDEAAEFVQRANAYWKANKRGTGTEHPVVERWRSMARLGRSGRVHLVVGIQRPDAKIIGGESRDQYGFRVALGSMSEQGARMVFGRSDVGRDIPVEAKGRATVGIGEDKALEVQTYYTPNPRECDAEEQRHLDRLRAAAEANASSAVEHINAKTIAAYAAAMMDPEAPLPTRPRMDRSVVRDEPMLRSLVAAERAWVPVGLDDLDEDDVVRVDEDGALVEVTLMAKPCESPDDESQIEVDFRRADGTVGMMSVSDDTLIERRTE